MYTLSPAGRNHASSGPAKTPIQHRLGPTKCRTGFGKDCRPRWLGLPAAFPGAPLPLPATPRNPTAVFRVPAPSKPWAATSAATPGPATAGQRNRSLPAKRAFDILFSLLVMALLLSWLVLLVALVIKLTSKGPVFFRQLRTGKDDQPFYCFKFRSMRVNNESHSKQATAGDARITRIGAFMRKTSIDELPQFLNVLRGDMSIVGPRPHMLQHTEEYAQVVNGFMQRHAVTPGITGLAQVRGYRGETKEVSAMAKRVRFDVWYINNWSFGLDVKIVALTVRQAVLGHDNAR